jgi:AcrR family transcriptional regulator
MAVEILKQQASSQPVAGNGRVGRTRDAIVASAFALAAAGEVAPIVRDVAKLAGVSARTVFQHFSDTAELYVAVLARMFAGLFADVPELGMSLPLAARLSLVVDQDANRYERLLPMWAFIGMLQRRSTTAADMMVQLYTTNHANLGRWFDRELAGLSAEARERTLNALALALAPESWVMLRQRLGLTTDQARDELHFVVNALLNGSANRR